MDVFQRADAKANIVSSVNLVTEVLIRRDSFKFKHFILLQYYVLCDYLHIFKVFNQKYTVTFKKYVIQNHHPLLH